jgi:hypothetical protein
MNQVLKTLRGKFDYSSARSPLRGTIPTHIRIAPSSDKLTASKFVTEVWMLTGFQSDLTKFIRSINFQRAFASQSFSLWISPAGLCIKLPE